MKALSARPASVLPPHLHQRLEAYAVAASAAGLGMLALARPAEAKIVYTPARATVVIGRPLRIDLNHDGIVDFYLSQYMHYSLENLAACQYVDRTASSSTFCGIPSRSTNAMRTVVDSKGRVHAAALRYGEKIQREQHFAKFKLLGAVIYGNGSGSETRWYGPWMNGGKGVKHRYLGLKFKIKGRFHFGWARIMIATTQDLFTATLTGYAYETIPSKEIVAGKAKGPDVTTVAPASLGHLAAGASAIPVWRSGR